MLQVVIIMDSSEILGSLSWDLDSIFSSNEEFEVELSKIQAQFHSLHSTKNSAISVEEILAFQTLGKDLKEAASYIACRIAQNVEDSAPWGYQTTLTQLKASHDNLALLLGQKLKLLEPSRYAQLMEDPRMKEISFYLDELKEFSEKRMSAEEESLMGDLASIGYHSLWDLYSCIVGKMGAKVRGEELSIGRLDNLTTSPDPVLRKEAFEIVKDLWAKQSQIFALLINQIAGFRLKMYEKRGWDDILYEPLTNCRMRRKTLVVMWECVQKNKPMLLKYLKRKAELSGKERLSWPDLQAPLNKTKKIKISYESATSFILNHFGNYSSNMSHYTKAAFQKRWVEAEDRAGKQPGGFCASFPNCKESRIFMTYGGNQNSVMTLAHELGHGYHFERLSKLPFFCQEIGMNVAETASTFAEMVVVDGALREAKSREEKLDILDDKLQRATTFLMNIHARYIFELQFYEERKKGFVSAQKLNQLMEEAQKTAYMDSLQDYFPEFWAAKGHFYFTEIPFYNFPYTFGFLFSLGLYALSEKEGKSFMEKYDRILEDSGRMQVEDLVERHLQIDLEKPAFWQQALDLIGSDIEAFISLGV